MTESHRGPDSGTLEDLLEKIEQLPVESREFQLWVPESLTFEGEPITLEAAMAVVLDELLGRQMFPDGYEQGVGGRVYRYRYEPTGAPPLQPPQRAAERGGWLVRVLRAVGIGPLQRELRPSQVWRYKTRAGEEDSRIHILKIDIEPKLGEIVHIAIAGVHLGQTSDEAVPGTGIAHVPVARHALEASGLSLEAEAGELLDFAEGYDMWRTGFEAGQAGVFSVPVAEIVDAVEETVRGGS